MSYKLIKTKTVSCNYLLLLIITFVFCFSVAMNGDTEEGEQEEQEEKMSAESLAALIHNRITGTPPSKEVFSEMVESIRENNAADAAMLATQSAGFYNYKLRSMFGAWSNVSGNPSVSLNDMIATMIGIVRDDIPFDEVLYGDHLYVAKEELIVEPSRLLNEMGQPVTRGQGQWCKDGIFPSYSASSNEHYFCLQGHDLQENLVRKKQSKTERGGWFRIEDAREDPGDGPRYDWSVALEAALPASAVAGILSTRGFASSYFSAGTNRRATAFVLKYFLCKNMEQLHDITIADTYVRPDVSREPGGDHELYKERCVGCHAGMDALSGWSVYYDFDEDPLKSRDRGRYLGEQLLFTDGAVQKKIKKNIIYKEGFNYKKDKNANDNFRNLWTKGQNSSLGWRGKTSGSGAKDWGRMISKTEAFSSCMATHVYKQVCFIDEEGENTSKAINDLASYFEEEKYNMRKLFAAAAVSCLVR